MAFWSAISRATGAVKEAVLEGPNEDDKERFIAAIREEKKALEARCEEYQRLLSQQTEEAESHRSSR